MRQRAVEGGFSRRAFLGRATAVTGGAMLAAAPGGAVAAHAADGGRAGDQASAAVAHQWIREIYRIVRLEGYVPAPPANGTNPPFPAGFTPPSAARLYAYAAIAMYEAALPGMRGMRSLGGQLRGLGSLPTPPRGVVIDMPLALSAAVHDVVHPMLFDRSTSPARPSSRAGLSAVLDQVRSARTEAGVGSRQRNDSERYGRAVAARLNAWIAGDGYDVIRAQPEYVPPTGPGLWQPTHPNFGPAIEPYWAMIRPLVMTAPDEFGPAEPPVPFSTTPGSAFHEQAMVVYRTHQTLTDAQRAIARFWTDNPLQSGLPSGHWMLAVAQFGEQHGLGLQQVLEAYARTGIALSEAFTSCWAEKYTSNLIRPVGYIREHIDPAFVTFVNTPQFPEYTSGHSVSSLAAATVLQHLLGAKPYTDTNSMANFELPFPLSRTFPSFMAAAEQAAQSRIFGGIHYPMGIEFGKEQGARVGQAVIQRVRTRR